MAKNTNNRTALKWLRDGIKSKYPKGTVCEISGETEDLEFHHYATLAFTWDKFCNEKNIRPTTDEAVLEVREEFYEAYWDEVVTDGVTLTNYWHKELHKIYGAKPPLISAQKQKVWVKRMRDKLEGKETHPSAGTEDIGSRFSKLIPEGFDRENAFSRLI